jgi:hypothetical protein
LAREGSTWRIGTDAEVALIANSTSTGRTITAEIPPGLESDHGRLHQAKLSRVLNRDDPFLRRDEG